MTTNAYFLPEKAHILREAGLHRLTVSLDSLDNDIFRAMNGHKADVDKVLQGIEAAVEAGFAPIKINAVVQRGINDHTIVDLARYAKDKGHVLRFIEYMDVGTLNGWRMDHVVSAKEIVQTIHAQMPLEPVERNYGSETALRFRYKTAVVTWYYRFGNAASGRLLSLRLSPKPIIRVVATKGTN